MAVVRLALLFALIGCIAAQPHKVPKSILCNTVTNNVHVKTGLLRSGLAYYLCHNPKVVEARDDDAGLFAVYSYPWELDVPTPNVYTDKLTKLAFRVLSRAANYLGDKDAKPGLNEAYQVVDLVPESHVQDSRLLSKDIFGKTFLIKNNINENVSDSKTVWESFSEHITSLYSEAETGAVVVISGRHSIQNEKTKDVNTVMYKVIFDRADASKSHAIAFDEQAEYPGLSKEKDGSCAQYGYDKYPGVVYCTSAEGFLSFLRMSLALTTGY